MIRICPFLNMPADNEGEIKTGSNISFLGWKSLTNINRETTFEQENFALKHKEK